MPRGIEEFISASKHRTTVLTMYNKRMYRIESVDFEKSPMITFAK